jgi:polyisoprenoid-binding protein YceI
MSTYDNAFQLLPRLCAILMLCALGAKLASAGAATRWTIDPPNAHIEFAIDGFGYSRTKALFRRFEGHISVDFEHPTEAASRFMCSRGRWMLAHRLLTTICVRRRSWMRTVTKRSISFRNQFSGLTTMPFAVSGDVTLLGLRKPLSVEVTVTRGTEGARQRLGFLAQTRIDRLAFGMNLGFPLISREVELLISSGVGQESTMLGEDRRQPGYNPTPVPAVP